MAILDFLFTKTTSSKESIAQEETSTLLNSKSEDLGIHLLSINERTGKLAFNLSAKKCLYTFIALFVAFLMMLINHLVSTNYLIFNFAAYFVMYDQFSRIIGYNDSQLNYLKAKERFVETIAISKGKQNVL